MLLCGPGWFWLVGFKFLAISSHLLHLCKDIIYHCFISVNRNRVGSSRRQAKNIWEEDLSLVSLMLSFLPTQVSQLSTSIHVGKGYVTHLCNEAVSHSRKNVIHASITAYIRRLLRHGLFNFSVFVKHLIKQGPKWCQILAGLWSL